MEPESCWMQTEKATQHSRDSRRREKRGRRRNLLPKHHDFGQVMMWLHFTPPLRGAGLSTVSRRSCERRERGSALRSKGSRRAGPSWPPSSPAPTCPAASSLTAGWRSRGHHTHEQAQITRGPAPCVKNGTEERRVLTPMLD